MFLLVSALLNFRDRQWRNGSFWLLLSALFFGGDAVLAAKAHGVLWPQELAGVGVVVLALLAPGVGKRYPSLPPQAQRQASAHRLGHKLFGPALLIPAITVLVTLIGGHLHLGGETLFDPKRKTLIGLALACIIAAVAAVRAGRQRPATMATEGRRLLDTLGWAALLPMTLAALGVVLNQSGVGQDIAQAAAWIIPTQSLLACVLAYGVGMAVFTVVMGNAFAAFPVLTAGIGLPLLVHQHGASPAIIGSLGMLCGYCGTLLTPMAANFNVVPVRLLELDDNWAVIRAQWPTAVVLLAFNLVALYVLA
nr:DUF979 family protein [Oleiagrimonas sp. C23AA]